MKEFGVSIRDVRKEKPLSISDLCYKVRMSHQAIAKIERGTVYPKLDILLNICQALEVKPSVLFALTRS